MKARPAPHPGYTPTADDTNQLEKAAWDAQVDHELVELLAAHREGR